MPEAMLTSIWPQPVRDGVLRARTWHLQQYTRWLTRAGAEPRLALVLCAGREARAALLDACGMAHVEVAAAPVTLSNPIAPALAAHSGNHFNTTLYVMDGLSQASPETLRTLDGQRGQLRRMATWIAVVVEDLATLTALQTHAPGLMRSMQRSALVLDDGLPAGETTPEALAAWRAQGRVTELAFAEALGTHAPDYDDLSRLLRAGYGAALTGQATHPERQRVLSVWAAADTAPSFRIDQAQGAAADAALRHARLSDADADHLAPKASLATRIAMRDEAAPLDAWTSGTDRLQAALIRAERCAETGDLAGCIDALKMAEPSLEGPMPELAMQVLDKLITLLGFTGDRSAAKAALDRMDAQVVRLASPLAYAQAMAARARFVQALDPARARIDLLEAERIYRMHGYPQEAQAVMEALA
ncbi:MAG: hypothetical protein ACI9U2_004784 [Bradymonadia bacterium]|jgi:hypothetical protein